MPIYDKHIYFSCVTIKKTAAFAENFRKARKERGMRAKKFLQKVLGSGYSKSAKQVIFNAARSEEEADAVVEEERSVSPPRRSRRGGAALCGKKGEEVRQTNCPGKSGQRACGAGRVLRLRSTRVRRCGAAIFCLKSPSGRACPPPFSRLWRKCLCRCRNAACRPTCGR